MELVTNIINKLKELVSENETLIKIREQELLTLKRYTKYEEKLGELLAKKNTHLHLMLATQDRISNHEANKPLFDLITLFIQQKSELLKMDRDELHLSERLLDEEGTMLAFKRHTFNSINTIQRLQEEILELQNKELES